ncbi:acetyl-CoA carboxylase biotin carboxylase subunit family protein [Micromonospora marina]|uniref:ATP-grasp domain-containing protein n=1 Tax=Micromonospora marina TaxID=307120 RepID=A0A1C4VDR3_9ACTN|nr:biotin carboxylase [Micromonospora marina]SCE82127.1 ATP-grasp domain-containing protein [Micromonospora marina]
MTPPHVVVLHRWRAGYADYAAYLDHTAHAVTYVSTDVGADAVPAHAREVVVVPATDDLSTVSGAVRGLAGRHGPPVGVVALKEDDLLVAAHLRTEWGCPGPTVDDTRRFRDKVVMCRAVAAAGVDVPAFAAVDSAGDVHDFATTHGYPVVLKPRDGSSAAGVRVLDRPADVPREVAGSMVQVFSPGVLYHVDGVFDGAAVAACTVSRYLRTCLEFRSGIALGSVEVDDAGFRRRVEDFTGRVLRALSTDPVVFHLELFDEGGRLRFLEVGARTGGAEIPFMWRELRGYDLNHAAFDLALGRRPDMPAPTADGPVGGFLLVPAPAQRPCRIEASTPMMGSVPELYAEVVLEPGVVLPDADAYFEHVGGRFRFRGDSTAAVSAAVSKVAADYRITGSTVTAAM